MDKVANLLNVKMALFLGIVALASKSGAGSFPQSPHDLTDVALIKNGVFMHPYIPNVGTSYDGRIGLNRNETIFYLMTPETVTSPVMNVASPNGVTISPTSQKISLPTSSVAGPFKGFNLYGSSNALCDNSAGQNPSKCSGNPSDDCYNMTLVKNVLYTDSQGVEHVQIWGTKIQAEVSNPKTTTAKLLSVKVVSPPVLGVDLPNAGNIFEPALTSDGRLMVLSLSTQAGKLFTWTNNRTQQKQSDNYNIMYSYNATGNPCDVTQWKNLAPVTHAHYDPQLQPQGGSNDYVYKFAQFPIKDPEGNLIPDGEDLGATYPWIDRTGANLFFSTVSENLLGVDANNNVTTKYPVISCAQNFLGVYYNCVMPAQMTAAQVRSSVYEEIRNTRGLSMAGLWTHGKMVLLDALVNNSDYGLFGPDVFHFHLQLYQDQNPVTVRVGTARDGGTSHPLGTSHVPWSYFTPAPPPGFTGNTTIVDSFQNLFNYDVKNLKPNSVRDLAWVLNMGKASSTISFDDYVDPMALIDADMNASLTYPSTHRLGTLPVAIYNNGQNSNALHLQNAATAPMWNLPSFGTVSTGQVRIEPVALGGKTGKGLWLDGQSGFQFAIPSQQGVSLDSVPWFVGLWFDNRISDSTPVERRLITFPDNSWISLNQVQSQNSLVPYLIFYDGKTSKAVVEIPLISQNGVNMLTMGSTSQWTHLAFVIDNTVRASPKVETFINGFLYGTSQPGSPLFSLTGSGPIVVGATSSSVSGIKGWVDDFKVIGRTPDLETICNHAGGTLVGMQAPKSAVPPLTQLNSKAGLVYWQGVSATYGATSHQQISAALQATLRLNGGSGTATTYPIYACYRDSLSDNGTDINSLVASNGASNTAHAGLYSIKSALHFSEGPLVWNKPRPNSINNKFCLSCHQGSQSVSSLQPAVLAFNSRFTTSTDNRRQPFQSPPLMFGNIPSGYFGNGLPKTAGAPAGGFYVDQIVFPGQ